MGIMHSQTSALEDKVEDDPDYCAAERSDRPQKSSNMALDAIFTENTKSMPIDIAKLTRNTINSIKPYLDIQDKVSLIYLLYDDALAERALQYTIQLVNGAELDVLDEWITYVSLRDNTWQLKLLESLSIIQHYQALRKLGYIKQEVDERFLPTNKHTFLYILLKKKKLYRLIETFESGKANLFLECVHRDFKPKGLEFKRFQYLEMYLMYWTSIKYISSENLDNVSKALKVMEMYNEAEEFKETNQNMLPDIEVAMPSMGRNNWGRSLSIASTSASSLMQEDKIVENSYPINPSLPGICLIINQKNFYPEFDKKYKDLVPRTDRPLEPRTGTDVDNKRLIETFKKFNYEIREEKDLTHLEMKAVIESTVESVRNHSSLIICILSHGLEGKVFGVNSVPIAIDTIKEVLCTKNRKNLKGKPKVLILQSCQGSHCQEGNSLVMEMYNEAEEFKETNQNMLPEVEAAMPSMGRNNWGRSLSIASTSASSLMQEDKIVENSYPINPSLPGICLIINQKNFYPEFDKKYKDLVPRTDRPLEPRTGTDVDNKRLIETFKKFNYEIREEKDLTHLEMKAVIESTVESVRNHSSLIICILSHGLEGKVFGVNSVPIAIDTIKEVLCTKNRKNLKGKPKVLILQSCQGSHCQEGNSLVMEMYNEAEEFKETNQNMLPEVEAAMPSMGRNNWGRSLSIASTSASSLMQEDKIVENSYPINPSLPGICLIINQKNFYPEFDKKYKDLVPRTDRPLEPRTGTDVDNKRLIETFKKFNYEIREEKDLTHLEMKAVIESTVESVRNHSSLIICILSHGLEGKVFGVNSVPIAIDTIKEVLCTKNRKNLKGKPKVLILQSCQGSHCQEGNSLVMEMYNEAEEFKETNQNMLPEVEAAMPSMGRNNWGRSLSIASTSASSLMQEDKIVENSYPINPSLPGICLIINQKNFYPEFDKKYKDLVPRTDRPLEPRTGTDVDNKRLIETFKKFNYEIREEKDLTHLEMKAVIESTVESVRNHSSLIICILSHGLEGKVFGVNSVPIAIDTIKEVLCTKNRKNLKGKPKVLILQSCQGSHCQEGNSLVMEMYNEAEEFKETNQNMLPEVEAAMPSMGRNNWGRSLSIASTSASSLMQEDKIVENSYPINPSLPGICLIINQKNFYPEFDKKYKDLVPRTDRPLEPRTGTDVDNKRLIQTFKKLDYLIIEKRNLTHLEMKAVIDSTVKSVQNHSSLIICILSHGSEGKVFGVNSVPIAIDTIKEAMCTKNKKNLTGKPKVLILQSCQGNHCPEADEPNYALDGPVSTTDLLVFYATIPGFAAIRDKKKGTWFIQSLCDKIENESRDSHFDDICTLVQREVTNKRWKTKTSNLIMIPMKTSTFTKFFFLPRQ